MINIKSQAPKVGEVPRLVVEISLAFWGHGIIFIFGFGQRSWVVDWVLNFKNSI
jgi:hypothetical protein